MIKEKLNLAFISQYKTVFSEHLITQAFREKEILTGKEILYISPIKQLNLFIVKSLFEKWQEELKRIESPYFNYQAPEVKIMISKLMNTLSQNISINIENLKPIIEKAVEDLIVLNFDPATYLGNEIKKRPEILFNKKTNSQFVKYLVFHKPLILDFLKVFDTNNLKHVKNYAIEFFETHVLDEHQLVEQLSEILILKKQELFESIQTIREDNDPNLIVRNLSSEPNEFENQSQLDPTEGQSVSKDGDSLSEEIKEINIPNTELEDSNEKNRVGAVQEDFEIMTKKTLSSPKNEDLKAPTKSNNQSSKDQQDDREKVSIATEKDANNLTPEVSVEELESDLSLETDNDISMDKFQTLNEIDTENDIKDELDDFPLEDPIIEVYKNKKTSASNSKALDNDLGYRKEPELSKLEFETINEQFQSETKTIADTHQEERITNILSNISINHQYMFVKELFGDSDEKFKATIKAIERLENFDAAVEYLIRNEAKEYQWNMNAEIVKELLKIIFRRFR